MEYIFLLVALIAVAIFAPDALSPFIELGAFYFGQIVDGIAWYLNALLVVGGDTSHDMAVLSLLVFFVIFLLGILRIQFRRAR